MGSEMEKEEVLKDVRKLVSAIEKCTSNLVISRCCQDKDGVCAAHGEMESMMVAASQELRFLMEYIEDNVIDKS